MILSIKEAAKHYGRCDLWIRKTAKKNNAVTSKVENGRGVTAIDTEVFDLILKEIKELKSLKSLWKIPLAKKEKK